MTDQGAAEAAAAQTRTTRLIRKIVAGCLAGLAVLVFGFWLIWVRAPGPEEVCAYKIQLILDTTPADQREGADALIAQLELKCVEAAHTKIRLRGKLVWADYAKCVTASEDLMDVEDC